MAMYRPRRSSAEWQAIIDEQAQSDVSAKRFCAERDIGYPSFLSWKHKLSWAESAGSATGAPAFIELTGPIVHHATREVDDTQPSPGWLAELDLGGGICLRIASPR